MITARELAISISSLLRIARIVGARREGPFSRLWPDPTRLLPSNPVIRLPAERTAVARRPKIDPLLAETANAILQAANFTQARFEQQYADLLATDPDAAATFFASLVPASARSVSPHCRPNAYKYVAEAHGHIHKWTSYFLPYMNSVRSAYELGVGPGYLLKFMADVYGTQIRGCDLAQSKNLVFAAVREQLGISKLVDEHEIKPRRPIPIPDGCEAVLGFWTVFTERWTVSDHAWFLDYCRERLSGNKRVFLLFNARNYDDAPDVRCFYAARAAFPLQDAAGCDLAVRDKRAFCIVDL